jgi:hypothetical protein
MNRPLILVTIASLAVGCLDSRAGEPTFRVRADLSAPLNANSGWAGAPGELVDVTADRPFRIRFEVEGWATISASGDVPGTDPVLRLQVRRNEGPWSAVEAHDFPYPQRRYAVDFQSAPEDVSSALEGWTFPGDGLRDGLGGAVMRDTEGSRILSVRAGTDPSIGLMPSPWELDDFSLQARMRFPESEIGAAGLVFGFVNAGNFGLLTLDPVRGMVRMTHTSGGEERTLAEVPMQLPRGRWIDVEVQGDGDEFEVQVEFGAADSGASAGSPADQGGELRLAIPRDQAIPAEGLGFYVAPGATAEFRRFILEGEPRTPGVSVVGLDEFENGTPTSDLLKGSRHRFLSGSGGVNLAAYARVPEELADSSRSGSAQSRTSQSGGAHIEVEWPLVIRRLADGALHQEDGDRFSFRLVDGQGNVIPGAPEASVTLRVAPGHLGGTYVETPGRIGPWQASNGDLYFVMEPAETDNKFLMMKSSDDGKTWREVDGANRPRTGDLEAVDGRMVDGTIYLIHQITRSVRLHVFHTSDHPTEPDQWGVTDEVAGTATAVAQLATLERRSDGSLVTVLTGETLYYSERAPSGTWGTTTRLDPNEEVFTTGPQAILGAGDRIHLAYYSMDGRIWYRWMDPDGSFGPRTELARGAGSTRSEFGAVLPLAYLPRAGAVVIVYRLDDATLWERRVFEDSSGVRISDPVRVTDRRVITNAVDSQQPAADVVVDLETETVHVLFVEESTRSLFHTHDRGGWNEARVQVDGILGSWVRGQILTRRDGARVYGYVYDAGSFGGAGMNRYGEVPLGDR